MAEDIAVIGIKMETDGIDRGRKSLQDLIDAGAKVGATMKAVEDGAGSAGKGVGVAGGAASKAADGLRDLSREGGGAASSMKSVGTSALDTAASFRSIVSTGVAGFLGSEIVRGAAAAAKSIYEASAATERLKTTLAFAIGGNPAKEMAYLGEVTNRLGLEFKSTATAYAQFQAAAKGTALEGGRARDVFESIAKASAVMGLSTENTSGVLLALQQMLSKGTVSAEELRGQLGERLPGAFQVAAKSMGVTTAELGKMLEQGLVLSDDFLPKFARELEASLGDAPEKAADRLDASTNRMANAWEKLKQNIGDSGLSKGLSGQYAILSDGLTNVSESIEKARRQGGGFTSQMVAATGAALEFLNPLQAISYAALSNAEALKQAEAEFKRLQDMGAATTENIYLKSSFAELAKYILKLREAREEQSALTGGGSGGVDQSQFKSRGQSYADETKRLDGVRTAMQKVQLGLAGVKDGFYKDLNALKAGYEDGLLSQSAYQKSVAELMKKNGGSTGGTESAKAIKSEQNAYTELIASIKAKIEVDRLELALGVNATESQKIRAKLDQDLAAGKIKLSEAHKLSTKALLDELAALEKQQKAYDEALKSATARQDLRAKEAAGINDYLVAQQEAAAKSLGSVKERVQSLVDEQSAVDLSIALNISLAEAIERVAIARLQEKQAGFYQDSEGYAALQKEIDARNELARLAGSKAKREAATEANKQITQDWERTVNQIDDTFRAGFADMVNNGTSSWKSFTKSLATTFKTTVADAIYKTFAQKFVVNMVANVLGVTGLSGAANAVAGGSGSSGGLINNASNAYSLYGAATGYSNGVATAASFLGAGSAAGSSALALGYGNAVGAIGGDALGAMIAGNGAWAGVSVAAAEGAAAGAAAGTAVAAEGVAAGGAATAGTGILASIPVWGWAGLAAVAVASIFGGRKGGPKVGSFEGMGVGELATNSNSAAALAVTTSIEAGFKNTAAILGDTASTLQSGVAFALDPQGDSQTQLQVVGTLNGQQVYNRSDRLGGGIENVARGEEALTKAIAEETTRAVYAGLQPSSIAQQMKDYLAGVDIGADPALLTQRLNEVLQIKALASAYKGLSNNLSLVFASSTAASQSLLAVFGGLESFNTAFSAYYENFYSDQERSALTVKNLSTSLAALGYTLPSTRDGFRALVDAQDLTTESGRSTYAALLGLSEAFASVTDSAASAADAAKAAADALAATTDAAYATLERSIQSQRTAVQAAEAAAQESVTSLTSIFDLLQSSTKELYATVEANQVQAASTANQFIAQALSTAQKTGYLPDETVLSDAITAARTGLDNSNFSTAIDQQRATLVLAGQLQSLQDITGVQKSFAEQQLDAATAQVENLDAILKASKDQLDALRGIDTSVLTVAAALSLFTSAIVAEGGTGMTPAEALAGILTNAGATVSATTVQAALLPIQGEQASAQLFTEFVTGMAKLQTAMEQAVLNTSQTNRTIDRLAVGGDALQVRVIA